MRKHNYDWNVRIDPLGIDRDLIRSETDLEKLRKWNESIENYLFFQKSIMDHNKKARFQYSLSQHLLILVRERMKQIKADMGFKTRLDIKREHSLACKFFEIAKETLPRETFTTIRNEALLRSDNLIREWYDRFGYKLEEPNT